VQTDNEDEQSIDWGREWKWGGIEDWIEVQWKTIDLLEIVGERNRG